MNEHPIQWLAPSPLWPELAGGNGSPSAAFREPSILRFATDDFMQDFYHVLATDPRKLGEFRAVRETWRGKLTQPTIPTPKKVFALHLQRLASSLRRPSGTGLRLGESVDTKAQNHLKLYQPAHMRYYLVSACLTCQIPGLPDRKVDAGKQQRVGFVVRRLFPPTNEGAEYAWVKTQAGFAWQLVQTQPSGREDVLLETEERLPLFPASLRDDDQRSRRVFAGLIPVGKREAYLGAQKATSPNATPLGKTSVTARKILLRKQVIEPWKALVRQMDKAGQANTTKVENTGKRVHIDADNDSIKSTREQAQVLSWLILSDFAEYLSLYIPELWHGVLSGTGPGSGQPNIAAAYHALLQTSMSATLAAALQSEFIKPSKTFQSLGYPTPPTSLQAALAQFGQGTDALNTNLRQKLDSADQPYSRQPDADRSRWPNFLFTLADSVLGPVQPPKLNLGTLKDDEQNELSLDEDPAVDDPLERIDKLAVLLVRALAESKLGGSAPVPEIPTAAIVPADASSGLFRIRCVYERPACGPLHDDVVSEPTESFELAGFFDPDAPARPIRIGLPIDTTPAGLRKFDKNTAFIMSDILCGQVQKMKNLGFIDLVLSVLPWPFHQDLPVADMKPCGSPSANFGMICSLSIPIITICALILLMIMVTLLDIIFSWLPFFIICFPLPGFKAKKS